MSTSKLEQRLEGGEPVTGIFRPSGASESFATPGVLTWSNDTGALLELAERSDPWPQDFGERFTVHGNTHEGGPITLLDARVRRLSSFDRASHVESWTLAMGTLMNSDDVWSIAKYRPGSLHEWLPETGLSIEHLDDQFDSVRVEWRRPERRTTIMDGGEVSINPGRYYSWSYSPRWLIETTMTFGVRANPPLTIHEHWKQFRSPLLGFCMFAADRPDDLIYESYSNPEADKHAVVLRCNRSPLERDWSPLSGVYIFRADDLDDITSSLATWFKLWHRSFPALPLLCETIEEGNLFSAPRFLTLYTAAEAYWKKTWNEKTGKPWSPSRLADHAGISEDITGCTRDALALIGETRKYHAHLGEPKNHTVEEIVEQTYASTRRLHVLLQACIMRDLGLKQSKIESLLSDHYRSWPVP